MINMTPITPALTAAISEEGWFDDEDANVEMGYGPGVKGIEAAYIDIRDAGERGELFGLSSNGSPVGVVKLSVFGAPRNRAEFSLVMAPRVRNGLGAKMIPKAIDKIREETLGVGTHRLESEILERNKSAIRMLKSCGFRPEGVRKHRLWVGGKPENTVTMRCLRSEWRKKK